MGIALALQDLLHVDHGLVVATRAGQLHCGCALGVEIAPIVFRPDQRILQSDLLGAQILGNAKSSLCHAWVLGLDGLGSVVVQGDIETIALAGKFRRQQAVDRVFAQR